MIRVNLLKAFGAPSASGDAGVAVTITPDIRNTALKKMFLALLPLFAAVAVEKISIASLESDVSRLAGELGKIEEKIKALGANAPLVAQYKEREKVINEEKKIISDLSGLRLREVKAMDALQNILPAKTWFDSLTMNEGQVVLSGYSLSDNGAEELVEGLRSTVFFSDIDLKRVEATQIAGQAGKKFELEFKVGKRDEIKPGVTK